VDERPLFSPAEQRVLESLLRHGVNFMVVGLSGAALQGAPVVTQDIDLWFEKLGEPTMVKALMEVGAGYAPPFGCHPPMLAGEGTELFDVVIRMDGLGTFADEVEHARLIPLGAHQVKVLPLDRILASKLAANRPKDQLVIPILRDTLATLEASARSQRSK
jgi:hypothetical protein